MKITKNLSNHTLSTAKASPPVQKIFEPPVQLPRHSKSKSAHIGKGRLAKLSRQQAQRHLSKMPSACLKSDSKTGQMYVDWSMMGTRLENSPFINWYDPITKKASYQWDKIDTYLNSLFKSMHDSGMNQMDMAFGQLADVDSWAKGDASMSGTGAYDSISQLLSIMNKNVPGAGDEMMKHIAADAKANGVTLDISFGGEAANNACMKISPDSGANLVKFCKEYGIDSVDFDLEGIGTSSFLANGKEACNSFLRTLQKAGIKTTLTTTASVPDNQALFNTLDQDVKDNMSGYNIMAYSSTDYYCSANNPTWGAEKWIDLLGKQNAGKLNWGFYDAVNYKKPGDGSISNGEAAAKRFSEMNAQLKKDGYPELSGSPFFWPDVGDKYDPVNGKCALINDFEKDFMSHE